MVSDADPPLGTAAAGPDHPNEPPPRAAKVAAAMANFFTRWLLWSPRTVVARRVTSMNGSTSRSLADRIDPSATNSYKEVLSDPNLQRYTDIRSHVGMNTAGLDVLGNRYQSDRPPLTAEIYTKTHDTLQLFYSVLISDSGTDVDHPVIPGLMGRADALIMVASTAPDGAKGAAELMDWAYEAGYHRLLQRTVVVINDVRGEDGKSHRKMVDSLVEKFS